ncbi:LysR family transcriptional regulator [Xiamenia xianingshaonis]|nr:LysR family transcriptional regulator [Xiamenia xianingshaonis]
MVIEHYQEFIELAKYTNFHKASEALHISPSTLSKHINALEAQYGTRLFERDKKQVSLTASGAVLLEYAQKIWQTYEKSIREMASSTEPQAITLTGIIEGPSEHAVMATLMAYASNRGIKRRIRIANAGNLAPEEQMALLTSGKSDCFVSYGLVESEQYPGVKVEHLMDVPLCMVVDAKNPLASRESVRLSNLSGGTFVQMVGPYFSPLWKILEDLLQDRGIPHASKPVLVESTYDYLSLNLGNRILIIPENEQAAELRNSAHSSVVPIEDEGFSFPLTVAYVESRMDESLQCLIDGLRHCYSGE